MQRTFKTPFIACICLMGFIYLIPGYVAAVRCEDFFEQMQAAEKLSSPAFKQKSQGAVKDSVELSESTKLGGEARSQTLGFQNKTERLIDWELIMKLQLFSELKMDDRWLVGELSANRLIDGDFLYEVLNAERMSAIPKKSFIENLFASMILRNGPKVSNKYLEHFYFQLVNLRRQAMERAFVRVSEQDIYSALLAKTDGLDVAKVRVFRKANRNLLQELPDALEEVKKGKIQESLFFREQIFHDIERSRAKIQGFNRDEVMVLSFSALSVYRRLTENGMHHQEAYKHAATVDQGAELDLTALLLLPIKQSEASYSFSSYSRDEQQTHIPNSDLNEILVHSAAIKRAGLEINDVLDFYFKFNTREGEGMDVLPLASVIELLGETKAIRKERKAQYQEEVRRVLDEKEYFDMQLVNALFYYKNPKTGMLKYSGYHRRRMSAFFQRLNPHLVKAFFYEPYLQHRFKEVFNQNLRQYLMENQRAKIRLDLNLARTSDRLSQWARFQVLRAGDFFGRELSGRSEELLRSEVLDTWELRLFEEAINEAFLKTQLALGL